MMSHMLEPAELARAGAADGRPTARSVVYVVDSAGALVPASAAARGSRRCARRCRRATVGFHAHNNLGCGVGNALAAVEAGATWLDGSLRGLGAGAGNAQTRCSPRRSSAPATRPTRDLFALMDVAEDVVAPLMPRAADHRRDRARRSATRASTRRSCCTPSAPARSSASSRATVLMELGRRRIVGGQEDMIIDVAAELAAATRSSLDPPAPAASSPRSSWTLPVDGEAGLLDRVRALPRT